MKINIAGGNGPMGKVHKPVFESAGHEVIISGRKSSPGLEEAAEQADLTIITVPISATKEIIQRVAPHCKAIMDFTSIKAMPINEMLKYSSNNCEVAGLHPLYGEVPSIDGRTVVYCPTERSGSKCEEIIKSFELAGAKIKNMNFQDHDYLVNGILQNARVDLLRSFAQLIYQSGLNIKDIYELSPPPTKTILDLIARQYNPQNDQLYPDMLHENTQTEIIRMQIANGLDFLDSPQKIRDFFGEELEVAQERAKKLISRN